MSVGPSHEEEGPAPAPAIGVVLHSPGYLALLLLAALIGVPLSLLAFGLALLAVRPADAW